MNDLVEGVKDLAAKLKVEYDKHKDCMEKYFNSVRELKIVNLEKIQIFDATIASYNSEI
jgi:hypothetical protein